jgi:hypothetical protein
MHPIKDKRARLRVAARYIKTGVVRFPRKGCERLMNKLLGFGAEKHDNAVDALATALVASVADPKAFRSGRDFSAWIGLVPKQNSSRGKDRLGSISKRGDRYLRSLFTTGALAVIRYATIYGTGHRPWLTALIARRPTKARSKRSLIAAGILMVGPGARDLVPSSLANNSSKILFYERRRIPNKTVLL